MKAFIGGTNMALTALLFVTGVATLISGIAFHDRPEVFIGMVLTVQSLLSAFYTINYLDKE